MFAGTVGGVKVREGVPKDAGRKIGMTSVGVRMGWCR